MDPICFEDGLTICISLLESLGNETEERLAGFGIHVKGSGEDFTLHQIKKSVGNVILVGRESLSSPNYASYLDFSVKEDVLNRIVIDESHFIPTLTSFHQSMFWEYGTSRGESVCKVILRTATAPPFLVIDMIHN